jgi:hypothetical protein
VDLLDVGTGRFTWRRLKSYIDGLRHVTDSAFYNALDPDGARQWTVDTYMLANAVDLLQAANWQRSEDGNKGRNKPKPVKRPSDQKAATDKAEGIKQMIAERKRRRPRPRE